VRRLKGILIVIIIYLLVEWYYVPSAPDYIKKIVADNNKAYTTIAEVYYEDYMKNKEDVVIYSSLTDGNVKRETTPEYEIILSEEESRYGYIIEKTYHIAERPWDGAYVYEGYVTLFNEARYESLVYSVDGTRPRYINAPNKRHDKIRCYRINDNWYYMVDDHYYYEYLFFAIYVSIFEWPYKVLLVVAFIVMCMLLKRKYDKSAPEHIRNIIKQYNTSYVAIAQSIYKDYRKQKSKYVKYIIEDEKIQCFAEHKHVISLKEQKLYSCQKVIDSYKEIHKKWDVINVYKYNVIFSNNNDDETLIYSVDNIRPFRIKMPYVKFAYCKKIKKHWYYTGKLIDETC